MINFFSNLKPLIDSLSPFSQQAKEWQDSLKNITASAETGAGLVKATVNGEGHVIDLHIDNSLLSPEEMKVLPELIKTAVNSAQKKAADEVSEKMKSMMTQLPFGDMDIFKNKQ